MDITLPSGHKVTLRDQFLRGDRRRARPQQKVALGADGRPAYVEVPSDEDIIGRILRDMIVGWDVPQRLPREAETVELAQGILDTLPDEDYEVLMEAVRPFFLKVTRPDTGSQDPNSRPGDTGTSSSAAQDGQGTLSI